MGVSPPNSTARGAPGVLSASSAVTSPGCSPAPTGADLALPVTQGTLAQLSMRAVHRVLGASSVLCSLLLRAAGH